MFSLPATYAVFDPSQMYSAKAEKDAKQAAKKASKDAARITSLPCGDFSCRICYNVARRVTAAISREIKPVAQDRTAQENDVQEFLASCRVNSTVDERACVSAHDQRQRSAR